MTLNLPNGSNPSEIILPDGTNAGEVRDVDGNVVWSAVSNYYLDMQNTGDYVDVSSGSVTLTEGQTFLTWIKVYQLGSSSGAHYPGIFSGSSGGGWDDFVEFYSDAGSGAITSGTASARFAGESASGSWVNTDTFTIDLDNPTWHLAGFSYHTDGSITFWMDGTTIPVNSNNTGTGEQWNVGYIGYAYAGDSNGGSGGKDLDSPAIWDRILTGSEVDDYYNNGTIPDSPIHHWSFNNADDTSTATDNAGSADGSVTGATFVEGGPSVLSGGGGGGGGGEEPSGGFYIDATATNAYMDLSSYSVTVGPGKTVLAWVDFSQVGSSGGAQYPGIFATNQTGGWNNFYSMRNDDGSSPATSGTVNVNMTLEPSGGTFGSSDAFTVDLDNEEWHVVGYTHHSDGSVTFWHNDGTITTRDALGTSNQNDVSFIGPGYAGSTNDGMGGKNFDTIGIWNSELSSTEVADFYNGNVPGSPQHLWEFDDDSSSTAVDSAGSADGTLNNTTYVSGGPAGGSGDSGPLEGFESGDFSNWASSGEVQITQSPTYTGSYAAYIPPGTGSEVLSDSDSDGNLGKYQRRGDKVRTFFYHPTAMSNISSTCRVRWGYGGPWGSNYVVNVDFANNNLRIWKNGYGSSIAGVTSVSYPGGEWWAIESEWSSSSPHHTARVVDYSDPSNPVVDAELTADDTEIGDSSVTNQWSPWNNSGTGGDLTIDHLEYY